MYLHCDGRESGVIKLSYFLFCSAHDYIMLLLSMKPNKIPHNISLHKHKQNKILAWHKTNTAKKTVNQVFSHLAKLVHFISFILLHNLLPLQT